MGTQVVSSLPFYVYIIFMCEEPGSYLGYQNVVVVEASAGRATELGELETHQ